MKAYCLFLICCIILLSCNSGDGVVEPEKELPPYCTGLKTGVCPESGYPFMSIYKDTVADSCYHVGFYFHIAADDLYLDNRVIYYYGKATIIGDIGHYWFDKKVIYEEEIDSLYDHRFQKILCGYCNDSLSSNDSITYYVQYHFEIECLHKYNRDIPPINPIHHHITTTLLRLE